MQSAQKSVPAPFKGGGGGGFYASLHPQDLAQTLLRRDAARANRGLGAQALQCRRNGFADVCSAGRAAQVRCAGCATSGGEHFFDGGQHSVMGLFVA